MSNYKKKIIVVEDKSIVSHDLKRRLEILGYEVPDIASSGEKAVELAREHKPDLVLMDIQLEGEMDGIDAANIIKDEMDIPVIYLTAFTDEATLKRAMITEPYAYIVKPFEPRELQISIEIALYKHEMESELEEKTDFLDLILKNTEEGIFVLDDDFNYVYINEASGRIMAHDPKEWVGKRAGTHVHPEDAGIGMAALQELYEKGKADFVARV
ncbi:MAG: response regulator, partial [Thermoplasmata archaeon]|nr:response regulator [Thermoplasmata archaeon]